MKKINALNSNYDERRAKFLNLLTFFSITCIVFFIIYGYYRGIFDSSEVFSEYIQSFGIFAPLTFIIIQIVQVVVPILPGGMSTVAGVMIFGAKYGFIYNYIGLSIGSIIAFSLSRKYGLKLVRKLVKKKYLDKYLAWILKGNNFKIFLAIAFFLPVAPDDLLCLVAGLSKIKLWTFIIILLLFKPFSIYIYGVGFANILKLIVIG